MQSVKLWMMKYRVWFLGVLILLVCGSSYWIHRQTQIQQEVTLKAAPKTTTNSKKSTSKYLMVDVQGAVNRPGVYKLAATARVYDAIKRAGGTTEAASLKGVNQAQKLHDQSQIYVPNQAEAVSPTDDNSATNGSSATVNLNSATETELQNISGIGPKKAAAIIDYRQNAGSFQKVEDLIKVKGIGAKTLESIKDQLSV